MKYNSTPIKLTSLIVERKKLLYLVTTIDFRNFIASASKRRRSDGGVMEEIMSTFVGSAIALFITYFHFVPIMMEIITTNKKQPVSFIILEA